MNGEKDEVNGLQPKWQAKQRLFQFWKYSTLSVAVVLGLFYILHAWEYSSVEREVKLKDIPLLIFKKGKWTTGRLTKEVPQLQCSGVDEHRKIHCTFADTPKEVRCYNKGLDGNNKVVWDCKADFDFLQKNTFEHISVNCEGSYSYPDEYALKGSCYLIYNAEPIDSKLHTVLINIIVIIYIVTLFLLTTRNPAKPRSTTPVITINCPNLGQVSSAPSNCIDKISEGSPNNNTFPAGDRTGNENASSSSGENARARRGVSLRQSEIDRITLWSGFLGGTVAAILWRPHAM